MAPVRASRRKRPSREAARPMHAALPWSEIAWLAAALAAAGLVTGFLAGLLGIGGGGVLVPVLFETFGFVGVPEEVRMHMVLGTSFAVIVPTTWRSFSSHRARGATDLAVMKRLGPFIVAGVLAGVLLVSVVSGTILKLLWIVCATTLAAKMALGREEWRLGDTLPSSRAIDAAAFSIGVVSHAHEHRRRHVRRHAADALRHAVVERRRDVVWRRAADRHSRHARLHVGRMGQTRCFRRCRSAM